MLLRYSARISAARSAAPTRLSLSSCAAAQASTTAEQLESLHMIWRQAYLDAGFSQQSVQLASGEKVEFWEREAIGGADRVCLFLHGMTSSALGSGAAVVPVAARLSNHVRIIVPDALGHGSRKDWTLADKSWAGYNRAAHVADVNAFLDACKVKSKLDLIGYSMGGGTAFEFTAKFPEKVRTLSLLAPGLALAPDQYAATLAVRSNGKVEDCVYNYRTESEAMGMMRLVGYAEALVPTMAKLLSFARSAYPHDYWWKMWESYGEIPLEVTTATEALAATSARLTTDGAVIRSAGIPLLVVQGSAERVIHASVPQLVQTAVGPACKVCVLDGLGHRGHPTDPSNDFFKAAGPVVGEWLDNRAKL